MSVRISLLMLTLLVPFSVRSQTVEYVPQGSMWRYLDDGSDAGTAWRVPGFVDTSWSQGAARLGYGGDGEVTTVNCGACSCPCDPKYITTYFRHSFNVPDPAAVLNLTVELLRDDGGIVYLNGSEILRSNMPSAGVDYLTLATASANETAFEPKALDPAVLLSGENVLAVEIHQRSATSSDIGFDLSLRGEEGQAGPPSLTRGPYLQSGSPSSAVVRFRTDRFSEGSVRYGLAPGSLSNQIDGPAGIDHEFELSGLEPETRYYYSVGAPGLVVAGDDVDHYFETAPLHGSLKPTRIWVIGDSGSANQIAADVYQDYRNFTGPAHTDVWLMLGDNAYDLGTDSEYQAGVFDMYPELLRNTFLWPTFGNHDAGSASSTDESGPYYDIFTLPRDNPNTGGLPTQTEAYYSFDWANIHFVVLDSQDSTLDPLMLNWADADLASTDQEWIIAFFHHPPYTKGTHDSDTEGRLIDMRETWVPILEAAGVDLVLAGHSHVYERSTLVDGHTGLADSFNSSHQVDSGDGCICDGPCAECANGGDGPYLKPSLAPTGNEGTVYSVVGSSSRGPDTGPLANPHPVHIVSLERHGAMVIDVDAARLDAAFIQRFGAIRDRFTILKGGDYDADGVPDPDDVCPYTPDPAQLDSGSVGSTAADQIGDLCQCGDVSDDGAVLIDDAARLARGIAGVGPLLPAPLKCNTNGSSDPADPDGNGVPNDCEGADLAAVREALAGLSPGVEQVCAPDQP